MNPVIKPAVQLMNRLSYRNKFLLIASLFAIPLAFFSVRLAVAYHQDAEQAKLTQEGLVYLKQASLLINHLEQWRDTSVINFVLPSPEFSAQFETAANQVKEQIGLLAQQRGLNKHHGFLRTLLQGVEQNRIATGNEAGRIHNVFANANAMVEQAYLWRLKLSYEFVSKASTDPNVISILDLINGKYHYLIALGEARAYGSFFLQQQYIDSQGIELMDNSYMALTRLINDIEIRSFEHQILYQTHDTAQMTDIRQQLTKARKLIDDQLIQAMSPEGDALAFYDELTLIVQAFYRHNEQLFVLADTLLEHSYRASVRQLRTFYISAAVMLLLLGYLYIGFFNYIQLTINDLIRSAQRVANGEYHTPISISAKDELQSLAQAMDEMRLDLQIREDELTRIGQTDGLTQLKNRKYFDESLPIVLASSSRNSTSLALVMMDIDHFKAINDQYGHQTGDDCIRQAAHLFKAQFQRKTDVVARYGGEEFVAILYGLSLQEAVTQTEGLRKQIARLVIQSGEHKLVITASFGVTALEPPYSAHENDLLALTDALLYQAKREGRNRVCSAAYHPESGIENAPG